MTLSLTVSRSTKAVATAMLLGTSTLALSQQIVQPGAPGQATKTLSAEEATKLAKAKYTDADVAFMQGMIVHHQQAVEMSVLVKDRTNTADIVTIAGKIEASQADEIAFMKEWLTSRGEAVMLPGGEHAGHAGHAGHQMMAGMATADQMTALAASNGAEFDRQFLTLMIAHHEGAIDMVDDLLEQPGSAADPVIFRFVGDIENDQKSEIDRMDALLAGLSPDPRAMLKPGFADAGEAILNLRKVVSLPKPPGFFDPENPADLRPAVPERDKNEKSSAELTPAELAIKEAQDQLKAAREAAAAEAAARGEEDSLTEFAERSPLLDFAYTDMAFFDDIMVAGSYHGCLLYTSPSPRD